MTRHARILVGGSLLLAGLLALVWSLERDHEDAALPQEDRSEPAAAAALAAAPPIESGDLEPWVQPIGGFAPGTLCIVDGETRTPIAGAAITLLTGDAEVALGTTDAKGWWPGAWPDAPPPWRVRITAEGYLAGEASCDRETQRLTMTAAGTICGHVTGASPSALAAGLVEVHAWESEADASAASTRSGRRWEPRRSRAVVQSDGGFVVHGLRRGRIHSLIAVGPSFGSAQAAEDVPADGRSVTLEGMLLHGALIWITGPNGASLLGGPNVRQTEPAAKTRFLARNPRHVLPGDAYLQWLGLHLRRSSEESNDRQILVYLPQGDSPDVELTVVRPGYETWSGVITLAPVTPPLTEIAVVLQPWTLEFGSVEVAIIGMGAIGLRQGLDVRSPDAQLHLNGTALRGAQEARNLALELTIHDLAKYPLVVGPVPAGDYAAVLHGVFAHRNAEEGNEDGIVRVRADRIARVEFDLSMFGVIDASLVTSRVGYFGPAEVLLRCERIQGVWSFAESPYRIPMLPPGDYQIGLVGNEAVNYAADALQSVPVSAGRVSRLLLRVNR